MTKDFSKFLILPGFFGVREIFKAKLMHPKIAKKNSKEVVSVKEADRDPFFRHIFQAPCDVLMF